MQTAIYTRRFLCEIVTTLLRKYHAEGAILFGSYARDEATPESDIDLVIIGGAHFDPTDVFAIADDLHRATAKNVDVYEIREIIPNTPLAQSICRDGVKIA